MAGRNAGIHKYGVPIHLPIAAQGQPMAIFTACRPSLCRIVLERFNLTDLFWPVVFAEEIGLEKRDPRCFVRLGELVRTPLSDCTLFDDSPDNCAAATKAGMDTVGVYDAYYAVLLAAGEPPFLLKSPRFFIHRIRPADAPADGIATPPPDGGRRYPPPRPDRRWCGPPAGSCRTRGPSAPACHMPPG